jgi:predicted nucleic acid-binding protein
MKDKIFIDSNIALYLIDNINKSKREIALAAIANIPSISPQVVFECLNVCLKKYKLDKTTSLDFVDFLIKSSFIQAETEDVVRTALLLYKKYSLQPFDSKIIASALLADCSILYSEDMQHGLIIENKLTIINPFL